MHVGLGLAVGAGCTLMSTCTDVACHCVVVSGSDVGVPSKEQLFLLQYGWQFGDMCQFGVCGIEPRQGRVQAKQGNVGKGVQGCRRLGVLCYQPSFFLSSVGCCLQPYMAPYLR